MKKFIRTAILVFALTVFCFSLSGCHALDTARNAQAFLNDDGTILYDGKIYKPLPAGSEYAELTHSLISSYIKNNTIYITEKDVPVLLSGIVGVSAYTNKDKKSFVPIMFYLTLPTAAITAAKTSTIILSKR